MDSEWQQQAAMTLRRLADWWHAKSPDRRLGAEEAHLLGNLILAAEHLADTYDEISDGTPGTDVPPGTRSDA